MFWNVRGLKAITYVDFDRQRQRELEHGRVVGEDDRVSLPC